MSKKLITSVSKKIIPKSEITRQNSGLNVTLKLKASSHKIIPQVLNKKLINTKNHIEPSKLSSLSPTKDIVMLKLKKDAIQRPYNQEVHTPLINKEFSIDHRNLYWRKKTLEQYKRAKNLKPKKSCVDKVKISNKKCKAKKLKTQKNSKANNNQTRSLNISITDFQSTPSKFFSPTNTSQLLVYNKNFTEDFSRTKKTSPTGSENLSDNILKPQYAYRYSSLHSKLQKNLLGSENFQRIDNGVLTP
ncbi:hypothetical protein SteCoe_37354 [Stentor coeruleus]|uniref:Uncharacterized protein n=1 Tax=Stentor coeruleus TaxID=5963 RepID=A0A1R2AN62_9CILI|nr:hypothetical protein SteCoe_37354 [Stentor coeruleus]